MMNNDNEAMEPETYTAWASGNPSHAYELFGRCVSKGIVGCMLNLGYFYDGGLGVKQDKVKAMYWYKRAYRNGDSAAAANIATLYREQGKNRLTIQ